MISRDELLIKSKALSRAAKAEKARLALAAETAFISRANAVVALPRAVLAELYVMGKSVRNSYVSIAGRDFQNLVFDSLDDMFGMTVVDRQFELPLISGRNIDGLIRATTCDFPLSATTSYRPDRKQNTWQDELRRLKEMYEEQNKAFHFYGLTRDKAKPRALPNEIRHVCVDDEMAVFQMVMEIRKATPIGVHRPIRDKRHSLSQFTLPLDAT